MTDPQRITMLESLGALVAAAPSHNTLCKAESLLALLNLADTESGEDAFVTAYREAIDEHGVFRNEPTE